ncbi:MAG: Coenzyme F420 hydrogenase/dehydrogenase, beta subunit C-terminal domain [Clostridia bacterium]|nr:Coenzyme F420 hydrogenase/dehydrogenase, beta subunit C-terminal domain [Clostridia bacterium]MBR0227033.1 Coenzyme F420 hydrogenase/dehydrogenase, beta subunit C-terminal domain [Clostridia bacterium]
MIALVPKEKCSGCSACLNACKTGALSMETDETGFWFPVIAREKCVECGACVRACPALETPAYQSDAPKAYIAQNKAEEIRRQSTSGGAFTALAKAVIAKGGAVFGAAMDGEYAVSHVWVEKESDLARFRGSKYVQSRIGLAYREAETLLRAGRPVCFSGTPCQIYGLKRYLGREYENLYTVDVVCRAAPSPKVLRKYLAYQKEKYPAYDRVVFRDKGRGYSYSGVALYAGEKVLYRGGSESDPWLRLFLGGFCNREACYECPYQTGARASDITLWDCWDTQRYAPEWDDNKGTTAMAVWTEKGGGLAASAAGDMRYKEIPLDSLRHKLDRQPLSRAKADAKALYRDCDALTPKQFMEKYAPLHGGVRLKSGLRRALHALRLHDFIRKLVHRGRRQRNKSR